MTGLRQYLRKRLLSLGYRVDCIRSIPKQLMAAGLQRTLEFEDVACRRMIELRRPLRFLQIGAFDGQMADPIYPFIRDHGWAGVLLEPQRAACDALRSLHRNRSDIRIVNAAIAEDAGVRTLYRVDGDDLPAWCGGLASFDRDTIIKHESLVPYLRDRIIEEEVPTVTFDSLLDEPWASDLDLLQIDTEGLDAWILNLFPFERSTPPIVHFEIKHLKKNELETCLGRLASFGYRFAPSGGEDLLAVR